MKTQLMFTRKSFWLLVFTIITSSKICAQQVINTAIQFDGRTRQYRLYIPQSYNPNTPVPLVLNYHGFNNNITIQYDQSNFQQLAEDNQFIFATPQGIASGWAINNSFGGSEDDIGFTDAMIDAIQGQYNINSKRIYATGFSNGGYFSYRLACELSNRIAAVASVAGSMTARWIDTGQCQPQHPTAVLQITGTNDIIIPIGGGGFGKSINDVMQYWTNYNNGSTTPQSTDLGSGSTQFVYGNGDNGVITQFISVGGKGHSWNGGNVNTSDVIWDFFSRFDIDGALNSTPPPPPSPTEDTCSGNVVSFPYTESFEGSLGTWEQATGDDLNWIIDANGTPSNGTGPSNAVDGNSYIYLEASGDGSGYPFKSAILNSPCLDFSGENSLSLLFNYHMVGSAVGTLVVEARTSNSGSWIPVFRRTGAQGTGWNQANISLAAYAGNSSVQLRLNAVSGDSWQGDIAIDGLAITSSGGNTPPVPPTSEGCADGITSFPYAQSFDESSFPGWSNNSGNDVDWALRSSATPSSETGPSAAADGTTYAYVEASTQGTGFPSKNAILNAPCFDLSNLSAATFSFEYHMFGADIGNFTVEASADNGTSWTPIFARSGSQDNSWRIANINIASYVGGSVQFRFNVVTGNGFAGDIAIDAVKLVSGAPFASKIPAVNGGSTDFVVKLYPNPVLQDGQLHVVLDNVTNVVPTYQINNLMGQQIDQGVLKTTPIDVSDFASGSYTIQVYNNTVKVIKQFVVN